MTDETLPVLFLIGPRASGKSTVGRLVAERLGLPFHDTDDMVMDEAGRSIAEIVRQEGWESFRERESRALALACAAGRPDPSAHTGTPGPDEGSGGSGPSAEAGPAEPPGKTGAPSASGKAGAPPFRETGASPAPGEVPGRRPAGKGRPVAVVSTGGGIVLARRNRQRMRAAGPVFYLAAPPDCLYARLERRSDAGRRPPLTGEAPLAELLRVLEEREPLYRETAHHIIDATAPRAAMARTIISLLADASEECS